MSLRKSLHPFIASCACMKPVERFHASFFWREMGGHFFNAHLLMLNLISSCSVHSFFIFIFLLFVLLSSMTLSIMPLMPTANAASWYASVGSWKIERNSETVNFWLEDYSRGNITGIQTTPRGMMVDGIHSRYVDINLNCVGVKERRSALAGEIEVEEYTNISAAVDEPIIRDIAKNPGSIYYEIDFAEVWPVHFRSEKTLLYSGRMINDLEQTMNNLDGVSTSFRYSPELSSIRSLRMDLDQFNISLIADDADVLEVEFLPIKSLDYSIQAYSSGLTGLSYIQTSPDMTGIISQGEELFFGDYSLTAVINMSASNKNTTCVA